MAGIASPCRERLGGGSKRLLDRVIQAGGYISVNTSGETLDGIAIPVPKAQADEAAQCSNVHRLRCLRSDMQERLCDALRIRQAVSQFALLPQGQPERATRVQRMVDQMDKEGFGNCTNTGACAVECPKGIDLSNIARMNRDFPFGRSASEE